MYIYIILYLHGQLIFEKEGKFAGWVALPRTNLNVEASIFMLFTLSAIKRGKVEGFTSCLQILK